MWLSTSWWVLKTWNINKCNRFFRFHNSFILMYLIWCFFFFIFFTQSVIRFNNSIQTLLQSVWMFWKRIIFNVIFISFFFVWLNEGHVVKACSYYNLNMTHNIFSFSTVFLLISNLFFLVADTFFLYSFLRSSLREWSKWKN